MKLPALVGVQAREQVGLGFGGVGLDLFEIEQAGAVDRDEVAAPIFGVGLTIDVAGGLEPGHDGVDVVAVDSEAPADIAATHGPDAVAIAEAEGEVDLDTVAPHPRRAEEDDENEGIPIEAAETASAEEGS